MEAGEVRFRATSLAGVSTQPSGEGELVFCERIPDCSGRFCGEVGESHDFGRFLGVLFCAYWFVMGIGLIGRRFSCREDDGLERDERDPERIGGGVALWLRSEGAGG